MLPRLPAAWFCAVTASLTLCPLHEASAQPAKPEPAFITDSMSGLEPSRMAQILKLLAVDGFPHGRVLGAPWPRREKAYLVAGLDTSSGDPPRFQIMAFDLSGPSVRRLASGEGALGGDDTLQRFDLAAFRLTTKEYAFGLRYARSRSYAAGAASLEGIVFFRLHGEHIEEVLRTSTSFEADLAGEWNEDGTRERSCHAARAFILVQAHKTRGHFDWLKKTEGGSAATFVWGEGHYVMNGPDPLETSEELEIFDTL